MIHFPATGETMNRYLSISICLLLLILGGGMWLLKMSHQPIHVPLIHVGRASIDLGKVSLTDNDLVFDYRIENWGTAPLRIDGAVLSCGCTKPELPESDILPNRSAQVRLRIDPEAAGEKKVGVTLLTNDPLNPKYTLSASWVATNGISVHPSHLDFGNVISGESFSQTVKVTRLTDRVLIKAVVGVPDSLQAHMDGDQLTVTLVPAPYPISGTGVVRLSIEGRETHPFLIPVTWHVDHAYQAHPSSLFLGYTKPGSQLQGVISIQDRENRYVPVDRWKWREELQGAICETSQDDLGHSQLSVKWTASTIPGLHRGVVSVQVSDHEIQIPVSALVGTLGK